MIQYIFPLDTIDDGRKKINSLLFTGITPTGYWNFINSGTTGFSLEISGLTNTYPTNNLDNSSKKGNIIVGNANIISGDGGYNFVYGADNYLASSNNSSLGGQFNEATGVTNSFIFGLLNKIYSGTSILNISSSNVVFSSNTLNNNYVNLIGNNINIVEKHPSGLNPKNNYFTVLNNLVLYTSADTQFVSIMPGESNSLSGIVTNSSVFGSSNSIGVDYSTPSTNLNQDNIYIFGNSLTPILSATTTTPLSGTYINDLCIDKNLQLNKESLSVVIIDKIANTDFSKKNVYFVSPDNAGTFASTATSNNPPTDLNGLFFASWINGESGRSLSGSSSNFIDSYGANNRWDIESNPFSANTVFMTHLQIFNKYIKYKG